MMTNGVDDLGLKPSQEGKRGRFEIRFVVIAALLIILLGGGWVYLKGSPTGHRAAIDSSENPTPTLAPATRR